MGPSLIDLKEIFDSTIEIVSYIGAAIDAGAVIGTLFGEPYDARRE